MKPMISWRFGDLPSKLLATCRFGAGTTAELQVLDLSPGGCMVNRKRCNAEQGARVLVKLPGLGFQPANVAWVEDENAGLAFDQPLHEAVLEHLWRQFSTPQAA
jgi:PilZ domain